MRAAAIAVTCALLTSAPVAAQSPEAVGARLAWLALDDTSYTAPAPSPVDFAEDQLELGGGVVVGGNFTERPDAVPWFDQHTLYGLVLEGRGVFARTFVVLARVEGSLATSSAWSLCILACPPAPDWEYRVSADLAFGLRDEVVRGTRGTVAIEVDAGGSYGWVFPVPAALVAGLADHDGAGGAATLAVVGQHEDALVVTVGLRTRLLVSDGRGDVTVTGFITVGGVVAL